MTKYYFDISDIIEYFSHYTSASGIQRVQLELIRYFAGTHSETCFFVTENMRHGTFALAEAGLLLELVSLVDSGAASQSSLGSLLARIEANHATAKPGEGDLFFVSGAFWGSSSSLVSLWNAKQSGARVGLLCYDLIPLRQPEFCNETLVAMFDAAINSAFQIVDFVATISEYVKSDVEAYLRDIGNPLPVFAVPLAHEMTLHQEEAKLSETVSDLVGQPYVLFVSTIEARKNHSFVVSVWQELLKTMPGKVPNLIWVGRRGWMVNDLMNKVERLDGLNGKLHILSGISDVELTALYRHCLFTIFPSLAEGWGLPVAESLMFGKPCVASRQDSIPEVGGDFVWYVDPHNITGGVSLIGDLLEHPEKIALAAKRIQTQFQPRRWADVGRNLMSGFHAIEADKTSYNPLSDVRLKPGVMYPIADRLVKGVAELRAPERMSLDESFDHNWYGREHWTRWLKGLSGSLLLRRQMEEPGMYFIRLKLASVGFWTGRTVTISCPKTMRQASFDAPAGRDFDVIAELPLPKGDCEITIRVDRADQSGADPRHLSVGLIALGFARRGDAAALLALSQGFEPDLPPFKPEATEIVPPSLPKAPAQSHWVLNVARRSLEEGFGPTWARIRKRIRMHIGV